MNTVPLLVLARFNASTITYKGIRFFAMRGCALEL